MKYMKYAMISLAFFLVANCFTENVSALAAEDYTPFHISAKYQWKNDSLHPAKKLFSSNSSGVIWGSSSIKSSHKMWFRVENSSGLSKGSGLLNYLATGAFSTYLTVNNDNIYYILAARRENLLDGQATVDGQWLP